MRGCLQKAKTKPRHGAPKGEYTWRIILSLGRGVDGRHKQKWVTFRGTRRQAERTLRELLGEVDNGKFVEPSKLTLGAWLDHWFEMAIRPPRLTPNTCRAYDNVVRNYLKPALGHLPLQGMTQLHVERYYADLSDVKKLAPNSLIAHAAVLSSALKAAVKARKLRENVAQLAENRPRRAQVNCDVLNNVWTAEEAQRFLKTLKAAGETQFTALFALALDSGSRRNELLGLQWRHLDDRTLRIEQQLVLGGRNAPQFALPKRGSVRSVDLSDETVALLSQHKREQAEVKMANRTCYVDNGLIFAQAWGSSNARHSVLGASLQWVSVNRRLDALCKAANVRRITVHGLRHTCVTLLLSAGVPGHVVQRRLGHKSIQITLDVYSHVLPNMQADAASRLAALLHG